MMERGCETVKLCGYGDGDGGGGGGGDSDSEVMVKG